MNRVVNTIKIIEMQVKRFNIPWVNEVARRKDPYKVLISCLLSLRTKDKTTAECSRRLFKAADTAQKMVKLPLSYIKKLIYPVGFYRNKAKVIKNVSKKIVEEFGGKVPDSREILLTMKGVGPKTANLVLGLGYNIPSICVDTHVHRISNRLGWCLTKEPEQTEDKLKKLIPKKYWIELNTFLVAFGQNICTPVSPYCSRCYVFSFCKRRGVAKHR